MFGVTTPISRCRRPSRFQEFDSIRTILSCSKVESSWAYHVQPNQGDLFYINVNGKTRRSNSLPQHKLSAPGFSKSEDGHTAHFRRDGMRHSDSAVSPSCMSHRSSGEEDDEKIQLRTEIRQKSEQIHQVLKKKQDDLQNGKIPYGEKFHSGQKSTQSRAKLSLVHQNNSRLLLSQQEENFSTCLKVRESTEQIVSDSHSESLNNGDSSQFHQKGRQLKEVIIMPDFSKKHDVINTKMSGAELFEDLMGITLCHYNQRPPSGSKVNGEISGHYSNKDQKLVVQGVTVGSPADRSGKIHRGDMLLYLNGQEVTWSNLKSLLQSNNREVKLTLQVPKIIGPTSCSNGNGINRLSAYYNMCLLVTGEDIFQVQQKLLCHSCVAMYLTLTSSDETSEHDDIVYSFPPQEEKLTAIRGLFLTLSSSLIDILQSGAKSSSLDVDHHLVNVVYHQHGRDVLILATPADRVPMAKLQQMLDDVARMLCTVYGSLDRSFSGVDSRQHDQLFAMLFYQLLGLSGPDNVTLMEEAASAHSCSLPLSAVPVLQLSEENKLICDEILSEFEAVDFDDFLEDEALYNRRSYSVLGCSLFYKNYLVCTHLSDSDHLDVQCFVKCQNLLSLAARQTIDELVIWQEVYLTRKDCAVAKGIIPGYQEPSARWFMLIVGMKHFLLASLLEAGGCSQTVKGRPRPHPLYIDQAKATLMQLDTEEVHMSTCCEERLNRESDSQLIRTDKYVSRGRSGKEDSGIAVRSKPPSPVRAGNDSAFKFKSSPRSDRRPASEADTASSEGVMRRQGSKLSYGSNDSGGSGSSAGAPKSKSSRFSSLLDMSSIGRSMSALHIDTIGGQSLLGKLTRGKENVLFHFIHYDNLQGVLLTPSNVNAASSSDSVQSELVTNFYRCVLNIHSIFKSQDLHQNPGYAPSPIRCLNLATKSVKEQGVLFHCPAQSPVSSDRRQIPKLVYWVVGRHFTTELNQTEAVDQTNTFSQELYVCFHESVHQSLVEVAFSLGFGS